MSTFTRYLTPPEERQLLNAVKRCGDPIARRDYAMFRLLRSTGIRVGSLVGLTVADARGALRAHRLDLRDEICKGRRGYEVYASKRARAALRDLLKVRRELGHPEIDEGPLLVGRKSHSTGAGMSVRAVQMRFAYWRDQAGLSVEVSPHWMRHTLAVNVMRRSTAQDPRGVVQGALGHRDISSTGIYTRALREDVEQALEEVA